LLVCFGCYVIDVCLSCLLHTIVNQHNPCALVIMLLFMLPAIFTKPLSWQTLHFIQIVLFIQISAKIYFWDKAFIKTKYLQNYLDLQSRVVPLFCKPLFGDIYKRISNSYEKTLQRRCLCLHLFLKLSTKALLLYLKLFSTWPWHDHWALVQSLFLVMLD
jgi:hypothetical protein